MSTATSSANVTAYGYMRLVELHRDDVRRLRERELQAIVRLLR